MITYDDPQAVELSIPQLLGTLDEHSTLWLWHNGTDEKTLETVRKYVDDPRVSRFHHSVENVGLRTPTNWLWLESSATYVSKVDDDCLVSPGWLQTLRDAHESWPGFGAIGSWCHYPDEFIPDLAEKKLATYPGGHQLMRNHWVGGSGYLIKRSDTSAIGPIQPKMSFSDWCIRAARKGRHNGFYYPFIFVDHMDDPRSAHSGMKTDDDLLQKMPLSAARNSVTTLVEWERRNRRAAVLLQSATLDLKQYYGWRRRQRNAVRRLRNLLSGKRVAW